MTSIPESIEWGVARGLVVQGLTIPLDVVKTRMQVNGTALFQTAREVYLEGAFYRGATPKLAQMMLKQAWCWPIMTHLPNKLPLPPMGQQLVTGLTIATMNAWVLTPFEKVKVQMQLKEQVTWKKNWVGVWPNFVKQSVSWVTFLTAHYYFKGKRKKLTPLEQLEVGTKTATIVGIVKTPFDRWATVMQSAKPHARTPCLQTAPLVVLSLLIHNIASVVLLNYLTPQEH